MSTSRNQGTGLSSMEYIRGSRNAVVRSPTAPHTRSFFTSIAFQLRRQLPKTSKPEAVVNRGYTRKVRIRLDNLLKTDSLAGLNFFSSIFLFFCVYLIHPDFKCFSGLNSPGSVTIYHRRPLTILVNRRSNAEANRFRSVRPNWAGPPWTTPSMRSSCIRSRMESRSPTFSSV